MTVRWWSDRLLSTRLAADGFIPSVKFDLAGGNNNNDNQSGQDFSFTQTVSSSGSAVVVAYAGNVANSSVDINGVTATKMAETSYNGNTGSGSSLWIVNNIDAGTHTVWIRGGGRYCVATSASFKNVNSYSTAYTANFVSDNYTQFVPTLIGEEAVQVVSLDESVDPSVSGALNISSPTVARPYRGGMMFNRSGDYKPTNFAVYNSGLIGSVAAVRLLPI